MSDERIMTLRTKQTINVAKLERDYDDSNPDVGMGPSMDTIIDRALARLYYTREDIFIAPVREALKRKG